LDVQRIKTGEEAQGGVRWLKAVVVAVVVRGGGVAEGRPPVVAWYGYAGGNGQISLPKFAGLVAERPIPASAGPNERPSGVSPKGWNDSGVGGVDVKLYVTR
jgi:hypothetical protein